MFPEVTRSTLSKKEIFAAVEADVRVVEENLRGLTSSSVPLIDHVNRYVHDSGGKRLRPVVLLLASKLGDGNGHAAAVKLAGVVELIHGATLVHDDIIDNAGTRRGKASVNATWGNQITVLIGDWMYMTAFYIALELENLRVLDILIDVTRTMVEGELIQLERSAVLDISEQQHMEICERKTACLFAASAKLGGLISGQSEEAIQKLTDYGRSLGLAFQLTDDLLDYTANEADLGKPVLKDLEEGKVTLPIIYLMQRGDQKTRAFIRKIVREQDFRLENKLRIIELVQAHDALSDLRNLAKKYASEAAESLAGLSNSRHLDALKAIPDLVVRRNR